MDQLSFYLAHTLNYLPFSLILSSTPKSLSIWYFQIAKAYNSPMLPNNYVYLIVSKYILYYRIYFQDS
jgi:hypothetical protein